MLCLQLKIDVDINTKGDNIFCHAVFICCFCVLPLQHPFKMASKGGLIGTDTIWTPDYTTCWSWMNVDDVTAVIECAVYLQQTPPQL